MEWDVASKTWWWWNTTDLLWHVYQKQAPQQTAPTIQYMPQQFAPMGGGGMMRGGGGRGGC